MKKLISLILAIAMAVSMCFAKDVTVFAATTGSGTNTDPYVVSTYEDLKSVLDDSPGNNMDGTPTYIQLNSDIISGSGLNIDTPGKNIVLDFNEHTLKTSSFGMSQGKLDIKNGTLESTDSNRVYASPSLRLNNNSVLTAKNVTFRGGNGTTSGVKGGYGLFINDSKLQIEGCTIISGNSYHDTSHMTALHLSNVSGSISDTRLVRGSGQESSYYRTLNITGNSHVTDGDGNLLSPSASGLDEVIIPPSAASPVTQNGGTKSFQIKGTYQASPAAAAVYSVDIAWGAMEFTYTGAGEGTWNPEDHSYINQTAATWYCTADANKITVTNHSNVAINAALSYVSETAYSAVSGTFTDAAGTAITNSLLSLATAENTTFDKAPKAEAFLKLDGTLPESTVATKIGTVTVTISNP